MTGMYYGLAQFELELMRMRTGEGRGRATARGGQMGRRTELTPYQSKEALCRKATRESKQEVSDTCNVYDSTTFRPAA